MPKNVEFLNSHDQLLTLNNLSEILKQSTLEEDEEFKHKDRIMMVSKLNQGLGLTEDGIKVSEGTGLEQALSSSKQTRIYEEILKERRGLCLTRVHCLIASSHLQGLLHRHLYCWTMEMMIQTTSLQFMRKCLHKLSLVCHISTLCRFFVSISFFFIKSLKPPSTF